MEGSPAAGWRRLHPFSRDQHRPAPLALFHSASPLDLPSLDEKIRKLDEQLAKHRDIIKKTRPGPAQEAAKRRALTVRSRGACLRAAVWQELACVEQS